MGEKVQEHMYVLKCDQCGFVIKVDLTHVRDMKIARRTYEFHRYKKQLLCEACRRGTETALDEKVLPLFEELEDIM